MVCNPHSTDVWLVSEVNVLLIYFVIIIYDKKMQMPTGKIGKPYATGATVLRIYFPRSIRINFGTLYFINNSHSCCYMNARNSAFATQGKSCFVVLQ